MSVRLVAAATPEQEMLLDTSARFIAETCPLSTVRELAEVGDRPGAAYFETAAARDTGLYSEGFMSEGQNLLSFHGRVAVVVGAGAGLGATLARRFSSAGASVALVARSTASLDASGEAARAAGGEVLTVAADIASPPDAERMAMAVMDRFGRIDVLVNAAFPNTAKRAVVDMDAPELEEWRRAVEIGGFGTLLTCRYVAPHMVERGAGSIVNVTSMSSRIGLAGRSEYSAGKAQAHKIAQSLAAELGPHGVRVNCVAPGHIWSARLEGYYRSLAMQRGVEYEVVLAGYASEMALRRPVTEDEVANAVLFLASDLASGITGAVLDVNAGHLFTP